LESQVNETWRALAREAALSAEHLGIGATAIAKTGYGRDGAYAQMFFALSIGLERSAKLALVVDYALVHGGIYPNHNIARKHGHNLRELLDNIDRVAERLGLPPEDRLPRSTIHDGVIEVLSDFATNITRYYNLDLITGAPETAGRTDPIRSWYEKVTLPVLAKHYSERQRHKDESHAEVLEAMIGDISTFIHYNESGDLITSVQEGARHGASIRRAQPYTRMYVLQIARFLARLLSELGHIGHTVRAASVPDLNEFYRIFNNPDGYLRGRKTWSIYGL
jgi:hypothetical protein